MQYRIDITVEWTYSTDVEANSRDAAIFKAAKEYKEDMESVFTSYRDQAEVTDVAVTEMV